MLIEIVLTGDHLYYKGALIENRSFLIGCNTFRSVFQTSTKRRKKMNNAKPEVAAWVEGHLERQRRKTARALEKKENRAKPNGKRYMPALDNQFDSSETYDSDSEDSIPEVIWSLQGPQAPPGSVPMDRRSFRTGPKKILEDLSVQDLKIAKRTSKDLSFDPGTIIRVSKWIPWNFNSKPS